MREIIHIQVGQCGIQISEKFWGSVAQEHQIDLGGESYQNPQEERAIRRDVFFKEHDSGRYSARSIMTDLESDTVSNVTAGPAGKLFHPNNSVVGSYVRAARHFARGHYTYGAELVDDVLDIVRREAEQSDCLQGFQLAHSIGGGTGSGLGTLLLSKIREEFPDRMMFTFTVAPSPKVSDAVLEPYNAVLAFHQLVENADGCIVLDNESLYDMCTNTFKLLRLTYADLNSIIGIAMSNATSSVRFPGQLNADLRKMAMNLIPFPRLHFFIPSLSPVYPPQIHCSPCLPELLMDLFQTPNQLVSCEPYAGRFLAGTVTVRGQQCQNDVENILKNFRDGYSKQFVEWIPDHLKSSCCPVAPPGFPLTASLLSNNTCIKKMYERIHAQFSVMFRRKAYLHGMCGEGMDEMEFTEAASNLVDLMDEYDQYSQAHLKEDEEE